MKYGVIVMVNVLVNFCNKLKGVKIFLKIKLLSFIMNFLLLLGFWDIIVIMFFRGFVVIIIMYF